MTRCLSVLECSSIQDYIFASNRLSEAVGGSELVKQATATILEKELKTRFVQPELNWKTSPQLSILQPTSELEVEVWYNGGGNAVLVFDTFENARRLVQYLSSRLMSIAPGLNLLASHVEFDEGDYFSLSRTLKAAFESQNFLKERAWANSRWEGLSITRPCATTGRSAAILFQRQEQEEWLSAAAAARRAASSIANQSLKETYQKIIEGYEFPLDLDFLSNQEGQSQIAVIHIDGNSIGKRLQGFLNNRLNNQDLVKKLRQFSLSISSAGETTFNKILEELRSALPTLQEMENGLQLKRQAGTSYFPLRPLIVGGDDLTFVCEGRLGLSLAALYLKHFSKETDSENSSLSACAGVVIVPHHFPLSRAYHLAEELCSKAKTTIRQNVLSEEGSSWLDFQIVFSGPSNQLHRIRGEAPQLYWRPWRVTGPGGNENRDRLSWQNFREILLHFQKNWARSQVKGLRAALVQGINQTEGFLSQASLGGYSLPDLVQTYVSASQSGWTRVKDGNLNSTIERTILYDPIEALDFYLEIEGTNANKNRA